jgi:hypothetical protein
MDDDIVAVVSEARVWSVASIWQSKDALLNRFEVSHLWHCIWEVNLPTPIDRTVLVLSDQVLVTLFLGKSSYLRAPPRLHSSNENK